MQGIDIPKICKNVTDFFKASVSDIDEKVLFSKRKSKIDANLFVETLMAGCLSDPTISLEGLCKLLKKRKVTITKQGLHQRFNDEATELMKALFNQSLIQFKTESINVFNLLNQFRGLHIIDSSGVSLPSLLKDIYKGHGGSGSDAALKIQVLYDYLHGQIQQMTITESCKNDQSFDEHLNEIKGKALYLQDLGYFKLKTFRSIIERRAYFISRYLNPTAIFNKHGMPIDLLQKLSETERFFAQEVWLDRGKKKIRVRLIATRLSDEEIEIRIRKLKRNAQKHGRTPKKETLEFAKWSIYITNVPKTILSDEQIYLVYSLRWQIELLFKLCKSEAGLDKVNGRSSNRILCEIYAKMMCVVMLLYFSSFHRWQNTTEISFLKGYKMLKLDASDFYRSLVSPYRLLKFITGFLTDLLEYALKDKHRKKRRLACQQLMDTVGQEALI